MVARIQALERGHRATRKTLHQRCVGVIAQVGALRQAKLWANRYSCFTGLSA